MSIVAGFAFFVYSNYLIWESSCLASTNLSDEFGTPKFAFYCRLQHSVSKPALLESPRRILCSTSTRQSPDSSDRSFYVASGDRDFLRLQCAQDPPSSAYGQAECFNECSQSPRPPLIQSANVSISDIIPLSCKFHWTKVSSPHLTRTHS
nr:unnamed protein product [Spirometra erinaceieuropaei]